MVENERQGLDDVYKDRKARNRIVSRVFCSLKTSQLPSHKSGVDPADLPAFGIIPYCLSCSLLVVISLYYALYRARG